MPGDPFEDEYLTSYLEATDRYTDSVEKLCRLADGRHHLAFLAQREITRKLADEAVEARFAMTKSREELKRNA